MEIEKSTAQHKSDYESPLFTVMILQMEQGIAVGSATVVPPNASGEVREEWEVGPDRTGDITW